MTLPQVFWKAPLSEASLYSLLPFPNAISSTCLPPETHLSLVFHSKVNGYNDFGQNCSFLAYPSSEGTQLILHRFKSWMYNVFSFGPYIISLVKQHDKSLKN